MAIVRSFHRYRGETSLTMEKLLSILREQLPLIAPEQTRYRVTTLPSERTIRFYTAKGLVDGPLGREGQLAHYGYRHLLQILAVKYLQSHYLPLRKVKSLTEGASNRDLEQLVPEIAPSSWAHRGFLRQDRKVGPASGGGGTTPDRMASADPEPDVWHRLDVGPGIELHVHAAALSPENRERLRGALLRELGKMRGWVVESEKD